ncbi:uncharacterized protein (TIGR00299 family) protein [Clostridium algifaecis]|uniref:Pyridinium-3,5-bisthiocarboxylic acid mononucleotide nickel insertion protein n=1 Tax=Clostridium algifaecis TaxID=1472040 RepID=A0ABS4KSF9_9CLOT|nr:nickel pincer cofactor biosynthesis protein LarC [Clostridium algifaecis]MBP2032346.1 uncharacterized protein (TIGR00299 family) protein [Clostridium algifaecis]
MKILYYDCFSGISGDMNLGAMIDVGVDKNYLISELEKLKINEYNIIIQKNTKNGISGTKVDVVLSEESEHNFDHKHNEHEHHHHHHRNLFDVENIINSSELTSKVKQISLQIFKKVAEAESKVHNKPIDEVHFHEVGAVDSIVDIVGAAICFDYLKVDKVLSSTVEVGYGFVKCAHGTLPVPAPATAEILKDIHVKAEVPFEATTPTGAAILSYLASDFTNLKNFKINKVGYGIGTKDNDEIPNVLRVFLGEYTLNNPQNSDEDFSMGFIKDEIEVMECNIDDMSSEVYEYVMNTLLENGALDVYLTPIIMKKGRPAVKLSILYREKDEDTMRDIVFINTTTLGIRKYSVKRDMLKRKTKKVTTPYGIVNIKEAYYKGKKVRNKPEYEDCKKLAIKNNVSIEEIKKEVMINYNK